MKLTLIGAAAHLVAAFVAGAVAQGLDFDQLRSRSAVSQTAGYVHDVLMGPHGALIRALPNTWLTQRRVPVIPLWLVIHSMAWGLLIAIIIVSWRRHRSPPKSRSD